MAMRVIMGMAWPLRVGMAVIACVHGLIVRGWGAECSLTSTRYWEI
jgi:hypothetical protein